MSLLYTFSTGSTEVYSLPSYSSVTSAQTVSQINIGNVTGATDDFVITTLSRNLTLISETFIYSGASTTGEQSIFGFYSPDTQYLYVGDVNSDSILVLTT